MIPRKAIVLALAAMMMFAGHAFARNEKGESAVNGKTLVAYYSYSGNTKKVAEAIHRMVGGDIFEIACEGTYPGEYRPMTEQVKRELAEGFLPKLLATVPQMEQYDVVFLGSPNWWGTITPQVRSFIAAHNLAGKWIIPFITHGGGGVQRMV